MRLGNLLKELPLHQVFGKKDVEISSITDDSRKVKKGSLFVAIRGLTFDGHQFINDVIAQGSVVVVGEENSEKFKLNKSTYIKVDNSRACLGLLASAWNGYPAKKLKIVGVTGTDGKTTTASIIYHLLSSAGKKVGLVTTVSAKIGDKEYDTGFHVTNPEPLPLHAFLRKMVDAKCEYAVLEVTSHGLDQERNSGIAFEIGVLTNITHEHLDYHKTYDKYVRAKAKLFLNSKISILNKEDESRLKLKALLNHKTKIFWYGRETLKGNLKSEVVSRFPENYNQLNATAGILAVKKVGISEESIIHSIKSFPGVPGRMEEIKNTQGFRTIVDFAHTPNALLDVLTTLKRQTKGRLIVVFGCASERDVEKRPMMGAISTKLADFSIFTAEDPRKEDIKVIINQIVKGVDRNSEEIDPKNSIDSNQQSKKNNKKYYLRFPERGEAIWFAINKLAKKGDTVVVCGKGHEKSMCYGNIEYPWSDQEAVKIALKGKIKKILRK